MARSAISPAGRALDRRAHVVEAHHQAKAGSDLEVGRVRRLCPEHALGDPVVDPLQPPGEGRKVSSHRLVVGAVHAVRGRDDRRRGLDGKPDRHPEPGAFGVARQRRAVALQDVPADAAAAGCSISSPQRSASLTVTRSSCSLGIEGRVGAQPIELFRDRPRACELALADRQRRHGVRRKPHRLQGRAGDHRHQVDALVGNALELEHPPHRHRRVGAGNHVQLDRGERLGGHAGNPIRQHREGSPGSSG